MEGWIRTAYDDILVGFRAARWRVYGGVAVTGAMGLVLACCGAAIVGAATSPICLVAWLVISGFRTRRQFRRALMRFFISECLANRQAARWPAEVWAGGVT